MGYDFRQKAVKVSGQCGFFEKFTDLASTILARDYKGFGNQEGTAVIENKR